jgi:hypothetical protein
MQWGDREGEGMRSGDPVIGKSVIGGALTTEVTEEH